MALAGIITGWIVTGLGLLIIAFVVVFVFSIWPPRPRRTPAPEVPTTRKGLPL